jgi:hypothetical protein
MKTKIMAISIVKTIAARMARHMSTLLLAILGIIIAMTFLYGGLLLRESLEDADFALKVFSAVLAVFVVGVGLAALITGHIVNEKLTTQVATLGKETAEAKLAYLELQERVRREQQARANLESVVTPREIDGRKYAEFAERLKPFAGTLVEVGAIDEREPRRVAEMIAQLLTYSGWTVTVLDPIKEDVGDGVRIHVAEARERPPVLQELHSVLTANNIVTRITGAWPNQPANTVRIVVGLPDTIHLRWRDKKQP